MLPTPDAMLSAGTTLLGGFLNRSETAKNNQRQLENAEANRALQLKFAQEGIRWKVNDAKDAGIHPLYALGAQTTSFSPVSLGTTADTSLGSAMASAGQDLSRSMNATRTQSERDAAVVKTVQDLELTNMGLKNELLASQIAKLKSSINPPMPALDKNGDLLIPEGKLDERTPLVGNAKKLQQDAGWSDGQTFEDRWGEWGGSMAGLAVMAADLLNHARKTSRIEKAPFSWIPKIQWRGGER